MVVDPVATREYPDLVRVYRQDNVSIRQRKAIIVGVPFQLRSNPPKRPKQVPKD